MHKGYIRECVCVCVCVVRVCGRRRAWKAQGMKEICRNFGAKMQVDKPVARCNLCAFLQPVCVAECVVVCVVVCELCVCKLCVCRRL